MAKIIFMNSRLSHDRQINMVLHPLVGYDIDTNHERAAPWLAALDLGPKEKETDLKKSKDMEDYGVVLWDYIMDAQSGGSSKMRMAYRSFPAVYVEDGQKDTTLYHMTEPFGSGMFQHDTARYARLFSDDMAQVIGGTQGDGSIHACNLGYLGACFGGQIEVLRTSGFCSVEEPNDTKYLMCPWWTDSLTPSPIGYPNARAHVVTMSPSVKALCELGNSDEVVDGIMRCTNRGRDDITSPSRGGWQNIVAYFDTIEPKARAVVPFTMPDRNDIVSYIYAKLCVPGLIKEGAVKAFDALHPVDNFFDKLDDLNSFVHGVLRTIMTNGHTVKNRNTNSANTKHAKIAQHGIPIVF
jgi:hypothetical protein